MKSIHRRGFIMLLAIVYGAIFLAVLAAISSFSLTENRVEDLGRVKSEATGIAEAGLEYYRWHLLHFPASLSNTTLTVNDPEGGSAGTAALTIAANTSCGQTTSVDIMSVGTPNDSPATSQTLWARYAKPSVAAYSYIVNDTVWAGADRVINGPYHANGGIRMDGTGNSPVTSSLSTWSCTSSFGCSPTVTEPGVFGAGTNQTLWQYPTPQTDFAAISANFYALKGVATSSGLYFARISSGTSGANANKGYHLTFNSNGTVAVQQVTASTGMATVALINGADSTTDYTRITTQGATTTYNIPANCGLIFVEDNTWIEGTIPSKVTLVAANVVTAGVNPNAILRGNIQYGATDGSDGLTLVAANDILISADSPQNMILNGVFIAQGGAFGRNLYACPGSYEPRTSLTILGTTVSNKRTGTKWLNGCSNGDAGYQTRIDAFDRTLTSNPPAFTPITSTDYQFVDWQQR